MTTTQAFDRRLARRVVGALAVVAVAWWFAGWIGILTAVVGLVVNELVGPRWVALAGAFALAIAALATLLEADEVNIAFTSARPVASEAGRIAAALAFVALMAFVGRERRSTLRGES